VPGSSPASHAIVYRVHISLRTNQNTTATANRKSCVALNDNEVLKRINDVKFEQLSVGFPCKSEKTICTIMQISVRSVTPSLPLTRVPH
jgi:hypothetical protein